MSVCSMCVCVLRGACESDGFQGQLVPAVSIPAVHVCQQSLRGAGVASAVPQQQQAKGSQLACHYVSGQSLFFGLSKNSCHVR